MIPLKTRRSWQIRRRYAVRVLLCFRALAFAVGCKGGKATEATQPKSAPTTLQKVTFGAFAVELPSTWKPFGPDEMAALREQFQAQSKEIYQRYNRGAEDPSSKVDLVAYLSPDGTSFTGLVVRIPPQADLMGDLKKEAGQKAKWGIEQGFIRRASEVKSVARDGFDGFFIEMDNAKGTHDFAGGLVHSSRKTEVASIMLLGAEGDEASLHVFEKLLASVNLVTLVQISCSARFPTLKTLGLAGL